MDISARKKDAQHTLRESTQSLLKLRGHLSEEDSEELSRQGIGRERQDICLSALYATCRKAEKGDMTALNFLLDVSGKRPKRPPKQENRPISGDLDCVLVSEDGDENA